MQDDREDLIPNQIAAALEPYGLVPRGVFVFDEENAPLIRGMHFRSVVLVGHFGSAIWQHFTQWWQNHPDSQDPLDQWSKDVLTAVAMDSVQQPCFPPTGPICRFKNGRCALRDCALLHSEY
jgi:hypothetical protein